MSKKRLYLFELSSILVDQVRLPYSTGVIWSHCRRNAQIQEHFDLCEWFYVRQDPDEILSQIEAPDIAAFSCFTWNWELDKHLAIKLKEKYPDVLIVFGGLQPGTSDRNETFFKEHPYADIVVHHEGEITFEDLLLESIKETPDWKSIAGCSIKLDDGSRFVTPERTRIADIETMPSPYLDGLFDDFLKKHPEQKFQATVESTRGCPYACTYCDIGDAYFNKLKKMSNAKVFKEIDWIADHQIEFFDNADSNFGMFPVHQDIAEYMVKLKKEKGYPQVYSCDWAKSKADKVLPIAKTLSEAKMQKGITVALQSFHQPTLEAIKRRNIDNGKLGDFLHMYNSNGVTTYVELILGLPEESLDSFIDGVAWVIELGGHDSLEIHLLAALPNTPYGDPAYIEKYGLQIANTYPLAYIYKIDPKAKVRERANIVIGSKAMPNADWQKAFMFRWIVQAGHYFGLTQFAARALRSIYDVSYKSFYLALQEYAETHTDTLIGKEYRESLECLVNATHHNGSWGRKVEEIPDYEMMLHEASVIHFFKNKAQFFEELESCVAESFKNDGLDDKVLKSIIEYQRFALVDPWTTYPLKHDFSHNIHETIHENQALHNGSRDTLTFDAISYDGDLMSWFRETYWYGRKVGRYKAKVQS